ncbi:MAG TPA: CPBP family intramembrane glutamic endopeptidase [Robiginitalea sp.]|nr:CPBP family intramembrane glutamic endopeptidase [Robiginitalea sp.]
MEASKPKPLKFFYSFSFFAAGALLFLLTERLILPLLAEWGVHKAVLFCVMATPLILFFAGALLAYRLEGHRWNWADFRARFRYRPIRGKMWLWMPLIVLVDIGLYLAVYQLAFPVVKAVHDAYPPPAIVGEIMGDGTTFAGFATAGNWGLLFLFLFYYFFNILGEEFLWRGYLFPRQELQHGKHTWLVHGLLWTFFHIFAPYNALMVLPGALFMSYVVQRTQNNTLFLISHAVLNGIPLVMLVGNIIG